MILSTVLRGRSTVAQHDPGEQGSKPDTRALSMRPAGESPSMIQENKDRNPILAPYPCVRPGSAEHDPGEQGSKPDTRALSMRPAGESPSMIQENKDRNPGFASRPGVWSRVAQHDPGEQGSKPDLAPYPCVRPGSRPA